ncbi:MAG: histidine kinase [Cyclobacteriaceae bacterium]
MQLVPSLDVRMQLLKQPHLDKWLNSRPALHISFWISYYIYRVLIYGGVVNTWENVAYVQAFELLLKIPVVYINLYIFLPHFLGQKKILYFCVANILLIALATFLQTFIIKFCMSIGIYTYAPDSYLMSPWKFLSRANHFFTIASATVIIKVLKDFYFNQQNTQKLEREKLETELKFLRSQINPHFFFNTLNNLYSLVERKDEKAGPTLLKLSELMSYIIYEASNKCVILKKEVENLENFISLERLRYSRLEVDFIIPDDFGKAKIAPLLLLPFLENAFKHGIGKEKTRNWIKAELRLNGQKLEYSVKNAASFQDRAEKTTQRGIGLENLRRRLELLYPDGFALRTEEHEETYEASLVLDLSKYTQSDEN